MGLQAPELGTVALEQHVGRMKEWGDGWRLGAHYKKVSQDQLKLHAVFGYHSGGIKVVFVL